MGASGGPIVIEFSTVAFQVVEGDTALPKLVLNQPFNGIVFYTISGTATSGDFQTLSGQVTVNGTTATIPVVLKDNGDMGRLKNLTLRLEAGSGYQLAGNRQTTLTIEENDADWEGTFLSGNSAIPFLIVKDDYFDWFSVREDFLGFRRVDDQGQPLLYAAGNGPAGGRHRGVPPTAQAVAGQFWADSTRLQHRARDSRRHLLPGPTPSGQRPG